MQHQHKLLSDDLMILSMAQSTIFMTWPNSFSLRQFPIIVGSLVRLKQLIIWDWFQSSGIFPSGMLIASFVRYDMLFLG